jgi:hypothetical protein
MIPVKTFQVMPPASFSGPQLSKGSAAEFQIPGNAGQFLRVKVDEIFRVLVQPPGKDAAELKPGGDSAGNWFYALPQTGTSAVGASARRQQCRRRAPSVRS